MAGALRWGENTVVSLPVSVQICTLNEQGNIGDCLDVRTGSNDPEEILVIDGGSTDGTVEIAEAFGARVLSPGRLGLGPSRRLGYMSTTSRYSAFIDADDRISPDWLGTMIRELEAGGYAALQDCIESCRDRKLVEPRMEPVLHRERPPDAGHDDHRPPVSFRHKRPSAGPVRTHLARRGHPPLSHLTGTPPGDRHRRRLPSCRGDLERERPEVAVLRARVPRLRSRASRTSKRAPTAHGAHHPHWTIMATGAPRARRPALLRGAHDREHRGGLAASRWSPRNPEGVLRGTLMDDPAGRMLGATTKSP